MEWIRSAKLVKYDVISAFSELEEIDWRKSGFSIEKGDIVYIYVGVPYSRIMFKTICVNENVDKISMIDDIKFWGKKEDSDKVDEYVRLKLIEKYNKEELSLDELNDKELIKGRIQGAYKSSNYPELFSYIKDIINPKINAKLLEVGNPKMTFHTITMALNYCFNANINYIYQKGTYPLKKDEWKYYMAWFPNFAYYVDGSLNTGSNTLKSNWFNIINDACTEIIEYNQGEPKEKYESENNFYRLVFGRKKKEDYKFLGVFHMTSPYEDNINYAYRRYEKVADVFDIGTIFDEPVFKVDLKYINDAYELLNISETEKDILAKARVGQGLYRENLIGQHNGKCMMCGLRYKGLLIASHIKEWSHASDEERLDVNNGLLLCTLHDSLFDKHLISFDGGGKILISSKLNEHDSVLCNISKNTRIQITPGINKYMEYHRKRFNEESKEFVNIIKSNNNEENQ